MNQHIVILGAGESGVGAALLAKKLGFEVFVSDNKQIGKNATEELESNNIEFEEGGHHLNHRKIDLVVKSPGIPDNISVVKDLHKRQIPVISEIEFASSYYSGNIIGITGTNGKTTTTGLVFHLLKNHTDDVAIGGNYGVSFARLLSNSAPETVVLELSSFQLDGIRNFRPHISVILNISPDHLDRYAYQMSEYVNAKMRITENQRVGDHFIYNADDSWINSRLEKIHKSNVNCIGVLANRENVWIDGVEYVIKNPYLQGAHNIFNAQCAIEVARQMELTTDQIIDGLESFVNVPHRMEPVAVIDGVKFFNDSKATNVMATQFALETIKSPIIWMAGGTDKGNDYKDLKSIVRGKVKALLCLGLDNGKLRNSFEDEIDVIEEFTDIESCVQRAYELSESGDVVLLSPACASFDLFKNYEDRGERFKNAISNLEKNT